MKDKRLLIIFLTVFIDLVGFGIVIPLNPYLAKNFGASPLWVGLLMGVYSLMQFIFSPFWGQLSDRIGRRPVILWSLVGAAVAHAGFACSTSLAGLFVARALAGVFGGNISTAMAYIADITAEKDRSKGMGMVGAAFGLGFICGPLLGAGFGWIGLRLGSSPPLGENFPALMAGAICLANAIFAYRFLPESRVPGAAVRERPARFRLIFEALSTPVLGPLLAMVFLSGLAMAHIEGSLFLYMQDRFAWNAIQASLGFGYIGLIMTFTQGYLIRKWLPKFGERNMLLIGFALSALGFGLLAISDFTLALALFAVAAGVTTLGLGNGMVNPSLNGSVSLSSGEDVQGAHLGIAQSLSSLARILGPPLGGWLYERAAWTPFAIASALTATGFLLAYALRARIPEKSRS